MRAMRSSGFHEGYKEGKDLEQGLLGTERRFVPEGEVRRIKFEGDVVEVEAYLPFAEAIEKAKERKLFSPTDPAPEFANDLHAMVADFLGLEDLTELEYYTALAPEGLPLNSLDFDHGVDAFFELKRKEGKGNDRVTLDLSFRDKDTVKADVLLRLSEDALPPSTRKDRTMMSPEEKRAYREALERYARAIVDKFNEKRYVGVLETEAAH